MLVGKKIAVLCFSNALGGLELSVLKITKAMTNKGVQTVFIVPPSSALEKRARENNLQFITLAPRWKYGDLAAVFNLIRIFKQNQIDIVLLTQSKDIHFAAIASTFVRRLRLVYIQQMNSGINKRDPFHTWIYSKLSKWFTLTHRMKKDVLTYTKMLDDNVQVLPIGIDMARFNPGRYKRENERSSFGLPQDKKIIGVVGRLDKLKGQYVFVQAAPKILQQHPDTLFVIAGDETIGQTGHKEYLQSITHNLGIEENVRFFHFIEEVPRLLSTLDIFVLPSLSESFGYVVIEAMAMNLPIVATNAGGVPEIIENYRTGLLIEPNDSHALAVAVNKILADQTLQSSLANNAREAAVKKYDFNSCIDILLKTFERITS